MTDKQIVTNKNSQQNVVEEKTTPIYRYTPAVDIYETDDALVMMADMPGVEEQDLRIEINQGLLTLEGEFSPGETGISKYYRQFKLAKDFDAETGEAELKDGVLTLKLPKPEAEKPKRIAVKTLH